MFFKIKFQRATRPAGRGRSADTAVDDDDRFLRKPKLCKSRSGCAILKRVGEKGEKREAHLGFLFLIANHRLELFKEIQAFYHFAED